MALTPDDRIVQNVQAALVSDELTKRYTIGVSATAGQARLTGTVGSEDARGRAEEIARTTPGVTMVINELVVAEGSESDKGGDTDQVPRAVAGPFTPGGSNPMY